MAVEANTDAQNGFGQGGKEAVVITASASQAVAVGGEGKSGDEDDVGGGGIGGRAMRRIGFLNSDSTVFQERCISHGMKNQVLTIHTGQ